MPISPGDLFLSPDLTKEQARQYLQTFGLHDAAAADEHLQELANDLPAREVMAELAAPLLAALQRAPDPDAALVGFFRYVVTRVPKTAFLRYLSDDPRALRLLVDVMGTSPFLERLAWTRCRPIPSSFARSADGCRWPSRRRRRYSTLTGA